MFLFNFFKKNNYSFFDKESGVYFNRAVYKRHDVPLTSSISRAIKSGTIIDVNGKYNIEIKKEVSDINNKMIALLNIKPIAKVKKEEVLIKEEVIIEKEIAIEEPVIVESESPVVEEPKKTTKKKKKTKKENNE